MKPDLPKRLRSLVKLAIILSAIIGSTPLAMPSAQTQQKQDAKAKQQETKKPTTPPRRRGKRKVGLWESLKGTFDTGASFRSVRGDKPGKFEENREVPKTFFLRNFKFQFESPDTPYFLNFKGLEVGERDESFGAEVRRVGKFRTQVYWNQIPHSYSTGRTFHLGADGLLAVNADLRAALQAVPDAGAPASQLGPTLPTLVRQAVQNQATLNLRVRSDQFWLTQSYHPTKNWEFYLRVQHVHLKGTRPQGTGTFAREGNGPAGDGVWETLGMELPLPEDYRTVNLTLGVQYSRPKWRIGFDYHFSQFRNSFPSVTWENPFRVTDALAIAPVFGAGRNRFARAQLALPPDNDFHSFTIHGSIDLPRMTQIRGAVTWGRGTQNEPFVPYTLNSALVSANLPAGVPGLFNLPTPQASLNGVVHTLDQDYAVASKPWKNMRFLFQYKSNDVDNQSPRLQFPALPAFGDSSERIAADWYGLPIENFPTSYTRQNTTASWQWDPRKSLGLELEYNWEIWTRRFLETPRTNEHSIDGKLTYKFIRGVALKADFTYANRIPRNYLTQPLTFVQTLQGSPLGGWVATPTTQFIRGVPLEFNLLRRFDDDHRIRKDGGVSLEVTRSDKFNYSASYRYLRDDYDKNFYGLHYDVLSTFDAQASYFHDDNTFFYAEYSRDQQQTGYRDLGHLIIGAVQDVTACCAQFPIANTYDRASRIHLDTFQFGVNSSTGGEKTVLDLSYVLSFARDRTTTGNPFPILPISLRTAGAYNYPDVINRQQEVNLSVTHRLRANLDLGFSYRFEPYKLDDYYTNNLQPYAGARLVTDGGVASVPAGRQLFLDARFTSYHANVATVFLRYRF
ncbi:MAG TPA: MtrB/PioB family outer membrane beta-barrel protein [Pyrinomonadaceae bacterium]|nr:MtrB/PioB family outer membrane beta-barrel protein [Pyrinomonadaceae bacterium]